MDIYCQKSQVHKDCQESFLPVYEKFGTTLRENGIIAGGISLRKTGFIFNTKKPDFHNLVFTYAGTGLITTPLWERQVKADDLLIIPANTPNRKQLAAELWSTVWLRLITNPQWNSLAFSEPVICKSKRAWLIRGTVINIIKEGKKLEPNLTILSHLTKLLVFLLTDNLGPLLQVDFELERLNKIWGKVNSELQKNWDLAQLAKLAGYCERHLSRLNIKYYGFSPIKYLIRQRISRAKEFLLYSNLQIGKIAELIGYSNIYDFSTAFKRETGQTPATFRNEKYRT